MNWMKFDNKLSRGLNLIAKNPKVRSEEILLFCQERKIFKFGIYVRRWKKNREKNLQFFFPYTKITK